MRIEKSIQKLVTHKVTIIESQLDAGFSSSGTFSTTFSKSTGLSPQKYKNTYETLFSELKSFESKLLSIDERAILFQKNGSQGKHLVYVHIDAPEDFDGIVFVGLFHKPIPSQLPLYGKVLMNQRVAVFENIPSGTYYAMACAPQKSSNPLDYFLLDKALRALPPNPLHVSLRDSYEITLRLRPKVITDPPITLNLPKLLIEAIRAYKRAI